MQIINDLNILSNINILAKNDPKTLCEISEKSYDDKIREVASAMMNSRSKKILLLAGPSSAGKTTSSKKLRQYFNENGINCFTVSLDDFYLDSGNHPLAEDGTPDFESIRALDLPLLAETTEQLLTTGECDLPVFDFNTKKRIVNANHISMGSDDILIFEGLHALNPILINTLPPDAIYKMYVSVLSRVYDDNGNIIMGKRDLRFTRRLVRDFKHRNSSAETTYAIWKNVKSGEDKYLFPFEDTADIKVDSFHPCEACILRKEATDILNTLPENSIFADSCAKLKSNLSLFNDIETELLSDNSLLREFAG
ncbi:MAG: hypothetical protein IJB86_01365 [Clostridia bacterium]|nr:hypothetical protein [Clostridia bacterium]